MKYVGALLAGVVLISPTSAHDRWHDDAPVPDWVKSYCCGPADAHHYKFDEVKVTPAGYVLPDYPDVIPANDPTHIFTSEDGEYWAFFSTWGDGSHSVVYCLFVPPGAM